MRKRLKDWLAKILLMANYSSPKSGAILMYHSVASNGAFFSVTPGDFEEQLRLIRSSGRRVLFLSELIQLLVTNQAVNGLIVLTFDDAHQDFYTTVLPLLKKYQIPATLFIPTSLVGKNLNVTGIGPMPIMSQSQIEEAAKSGLVELASHTANHLLLNEIPLSQIENELVDSQLWLTGLGFESVPILAYPKGRYSTEVISVLQRLGWLGAVTVKPGLINSQSSRFELPRIPIDSATTSALFRLALSEGYAWYATIAHAKFF